MTSASKSPWKRSWSAILVTTALLSSAEAEWDRRYRIVYATFLGGQGWDQAREAIVLPDGSLLIGAQSASEAMPTTAGVVQPEYAGDDPALGHSGIYGGDCYMARISSEGRLVAGTYFGGSKQERNVYGMALDSQGNIADGSVYLVGSTSSADFPVTANAVQAKFGGGTADAFVARLLPE